TEGTPRYTGNSETAGSKPAELTGRRPAFPFPSVSLGDSSRRFLFPRLPRITQNNHTRCAKTQRWRVGRRKHCRKKSRPAARSVPPATNNLTPGPRPEWTQGRGSIFCRERFRGRVIRVSRSAMVARIRNVLDVFIVISALNRAVFAGKD